MSVAFRIFLLILFGFGAIWVYRFRSTDLAEWLRPLPPLVGHEGPRDPLTSPVDEVIGPELELARVRLEGPVAFPAGDVARERGSEDSPEEPSPRLSPEEESLAADLPLDEDLGEGDGAPDGAPTEGGGGSEAVGLDPGADRLMGDSREPLDPPARPEGSGASPVAYEEFFHEVREGESLWKISEALLGSGLRYREIAELNEKLMSGVDPAQIPVGTKLRIRRSVEGTAGRGEPRQEGLKKPPSRTDTSVERNSVPDATRSEAGFSLHTVQRNENLKKIARRYYPGDAEGWRAIFDANRHVLASADRIREGQVLRIPKARGQTISRR
jgi:nucleoid-associated protein YgaU